MKVPKYIEEAVGKAAIYQMRASENNEKVRKWLDKNGINEDTVGDTVLDMFIDCCELTCQPDVFLKFLRRHHNQQK